jgi:sugar lactone lactonase YvrE
MNVLLRGALIAALVGAVATGSSAASAAPRPLLPTPQTLMSWELTPPYGSFAESMAYEGRALYVSRTTWGEATNSGAIERIPLNGGPPTTVASGIDTGYGLLAGLTFDPQGRLYVAVAAFSGDVPTGVFRVRPGGQLTPVLYLPSGAFPNGLAYAGGYLYVTDAALGAVWRAGLTATPLTQTSPWLQDQALAPLQDLGVDGVAFRGHTLFLTQYDAGRILTTTVGPDGSAGPLHVFADDRSLVTSDGITFDPVGNLWVTVNGRSPGHSGSLVLVTPNGSVSALATDPPWLDYPTQPVFADGLGLYLVDGSFRNGTPGVIHWPALPF